MNTTEVDTPNLKRATARGQAKPPQTMRAPARRHQQPWQRAVLIAVLGYETLGCLAGGVMLMMSPDGAWLQMPIDILHGAFADFFVPGAILFLLGILNLLALVAVASRSSLDWMFSSIALGGLTIWFIVEITIIQQLHWLHFMWGLPVYLGLIASIPLFPGRYANMRDSFLIGGIAASALYAAVTILVPLLWPAYDSASQTVSELSAIDAPTRPIWIWATIPYTLLTIGFGWSVLASAGTNSRLRAAGALLLLYGALGVLWPLAPMHQREVLAAGGGSVSDQMHLTLGAVTELLYIGALGFAAFALGTRFRNYSIATFALLVIFGVLTFLDAPLVARNEPTPLIGIYERINIGLFLVWMVVLSVLLLRRNTAAKVERSEREVAAVA